VTASFKVFEDFLLYEDGIYSYVHGNFVGWHSVKITGWGATK